MFNPVLYLMVFGIIAFFYLLSWVARRPINDLGATVHTAGRTCLGNYDLAQARKFRF